MRITTKAMMESAFRAPNKIDKACPPVAVKRPRTLSNPKLKYRGLASIGITAHRLESWDNRKTEQARFVYLGHNVGSFCFKYITFEKYTESNELVAQRRKAEMLLRKLG